MIKAVIFDLGGVYFTTGIRAVVKKISVKYSIPQENVSKAFNAELRKRYLSGEVNATEFWSELSKNLAINEKTEKLVELEFNSYHPNVDTVNLIKELRSEGFRVFYLSDNSRQRVEYLNEKYNFLGDFDGGVFSFEVRALKPDLKMYNTVLEKIGCRPHEAVFIDDKELLLDVPRKIGMKTIHFKNPTQLKAELNKFGVL